MYLSIDERKVLNRLRVIATLLVVIGHATRMFTAQGVYHDSIQENIVLTKVTGIIYSFHMPLFFLLSGYVYGICVNRGGVYNTFFPFIKKKSQRLLLPYCFWGIVYVAPIMVFLSITTMPYPSFVFRGIILGFDCRHLWFLLTLFEIFVLIHLFILFAKRFSLPPSFSIVILLSVFFVIRYLPHLPVILQFKSVCNYSIYFVCGLAYYTIKGLKTKWEGVLIALITSALLYVSIGSIGSICTIITVLLALFIPMEIIPGFQSFLRNSMGIYILHPMMLYILFSYYKSTIDPFLFTASAIVLVTVLSYLGCILLRKCKLSVLLGE